MYTSCFIWKILRVVLLVVRAGVSSQSEMNLTQPPPASEDTVCRPPLPVPLLTWVVAVPAPFCQVWRGSPGLCRQLEEWAGFPGCHQSHWPQPGGHEAGSGRFHPGESREGLQDCTRYPAHSQAPGAGRYSDPLCPFIIIVITNIPSALPGRKLRK